MKLSKELARRATGKTLYILDEPTTGLHFEDVRKLLEVVHQLVDQGNTVVVIEHNIEVIKTADWIIDLGPEGGDKGGRIVAAGTPEQVAQTAGSYTGHYLAPHLTAITLRPEFFDCYLDLAVEFALPMRVPSTITEEQAGFPFRKLAAEAGVVFPDHFDHDWRFGSRERVLKAVADLKPGVTELHVQPAIDTPEVRALTGAAESWIDDLALVTTDTALSEALKSADATLIGYRDLRAAMRS